MEYKLNLTSTENKDLVGYCNLNDLRISEIIKKSYLNGFNIERYGLLGDDSRKIGGEEEKQVEIEIIKEIRVEVPVEVIKEVVKYVETPVEIIKEVEVIKYVDREVIKEVPVEIIKEKVLNVVQDAPEPVIVEKIVEVPVEVIKEVIVEKVVEVEKPNDKMKMIQETLQKLRQELTDKNLRIKELEEINKRLESIKVSQGAIFLKGSNISDTL